MPVFKKCLVIVYVQQNVVRESDQKNLKEHLLFHLVRILWMEKYALSYSRVLL